MLQLLLQCDWQLENSPQKATSANEAQGISQMSPDPLLLGGVWARDYNQYELQIISTQLLKLNSCE